MTNSDNQSQRDLVSHFKAVDALCVIILVAYFLHFALPATGGGFSEDDLSALYTYWFSGTLGKTLWENICFWKGIGRPAGGLYYLPLSHLFRINPEPYRIVQISILAAVIPMVYYLARLLASSRSVAFLAVLVFCYHAKLADLIVSGSYIYDVLCGFFYFAALTYYVHIREKGLRLRPIQWVAFLALYVCALNSKELAVTLPVIVLLYELLKYFQQPERQNLFGWMLNDASPALVSGAMTALYCYNKLYGRGFVGNFSPEFVEHRLDPAGLPPWVAAALELYKPHYSWRRFIDSNARFVSELFYLAPNHVITGGTLVAIWALVFAYAFLRRDRTVQLMAFWVVITPLPLVFVSPRGGARLYILLFGWATIFAKLAWDVIKLASKHPAFVTQRAAGDVIASNPIAGGASTDRDLSKTQLAGAARPARKTFSLEFRTFATALVACGFALFTGWEHQRLGVNRAFLDSGQKTSHVIQTIGSLNLHPSPGSTILLRPEKQFLQNGFYPGFFASFAPNDPLRELIAKASPEYWRCVASLVLGDRSLQIKVEDQHQLTNEQLAKFQYVISFDEFKAKLIRGPSAD
jgi:hypothetical protein